MTCQNLKRLQSPLGTTVPCASASSPATGRWSDLLKDAQLARGGMRASAILFSPGPFLPDPLGSFYQILSEQRWDGKYYPLNSKANSDFYAHFGVSGCHHGGNFRAMEKNKDNARWALGIPLFHPPGQEALNSLILWSLFFFFLYYFRGGGKSSTVLWKVNKTECIGLALFGIFFFPGICYAWLLRTFCPMAHLFAYENTIW